MVVAVTEKLVRRCPLNFKMVHGLSALVPAFSICKPNVGIARIINWINYTVDEKSKQPYTSLTTVDSGLRFMHMW